MYHPVQGAAKNLTPSCAGDSLLYYVPFRMTIFIRFLQSKNAATVSVTVGIVVMLRKLGDVR
jgi:hypothetical protein